MGLYGVTAFVARQRTREIGVRLAVGATMADVVRLAAGLYGLSAHDPTAIASAVAVLMLSAGAAVIAPARKAARIDPTRVLRDG
jgi:ABC-type antimicrobial peptide transport system permease subunit